jgi:hypothetical protein
LPPVALTVSFNPELIGREEQIAGAEPNFTGVLNTNTVGPESLP